MMSLLRSEPSACSAHCLWSPLWSCDFPVSARPSHLGPLQAEQLSRVEAPVTCYSLSVGSVTLALTGCVSTSILRRIPALGSDVERMLVELSIPLQGHLLLACIRQSILSLKSDCAKTLKRLFKTKVVNASPTRWTEVQASWRTAPSARKGALCAFLLPWSGALLILFYGHKDLPILCLLHICPSLIHWCDSPQCLCIRLLLKWSWEGQFPEAVWLDSWLRFPPCWLLEPCLLVSFSPLCLVDLC